MKNLSIVQKFLVLLVSLVVVMLLFLVLSGENGLINQEKKKYNDTHMEDKDNVQDNTIVIRRN